MRTRRVIILAVVLAVAVTLLVTNPTHDEYVQWAIDAAQSGGGHFVSRVIRPETAPMYVDGATEAHDFGLFSLFYTSMETGDTLVTLGICRQFVLLRGYGQGENR